MVIFDRPEIKIDGSKKNYGDVSLTNKMDARYEYVNLEFNIFANVLSRWKTVT